MKLTKKETRALIDKLRKVPYFSTSNIDYILYDSFSALKRVIENDKASDHTLINKENITGLWYLTGLYFEEKNPQLLIRMGRQLDFMDGLYLDSAIFDFVAHDVLWKYDKHLLGGDCELVEEVKAGRVLAIYDNERE